MAICHPFLFILMAKRIAITGATGGIGKELVLALAKREYDLVFVNRNVEKSKKLAAFVTEKYPKTCIEFVQCNLSDINSVKQAKIELEKANIDVLILASGVYNVPIERTEIGYNNIFLINFISQYYLARKLVEREKVNKVISVGSIAYDYSKINEQDVDFSANKKARKVYGNSKKFLMFSLYELLKDNEKISYSIANPGITLTHMTSHYPKIINWIIKLGMKIVFPSPKKATRSIVSAIDNDCEKEWLTPKLFNVWGKPKKSAITCSDFELNSINEIANKIFADIKK